MDFFCPLDHRCPPRGAAVAWAVQSRGLRGLCAAKGGLGDTRGRPWLTAGCTAWLLVAQLKQ